MPKITRKFVDTFVPEELPESQEFLIETSPQFVEAGARAMFHAWRATDTELCMDWETLDEHLKSVFVRQFSQGLAHALVRHGIPMPDLIN